MNKKNIVIAYHRPEKLERAKALRREMTPAEQTLWEHLRRGQLGAIHFRRQQVIDGFIADFYCHQVGLILELDGSIHDNQAEFDAERQRLIETRGLTFLRFSNSRIETELPAVLTEILTMAHNLIAVQRPSNPKKRQPR